MKKHKKLKRTLFICGIVFVCLIIIGLFTTIINNIMLRNYISSFEAVDYDRQLIPTLEDGHYTFKTDDDIHIMVINDIHLGGGKYTYKTDKKTVYEVMSMVQQEKPDLVILGGDQIFAVPGPVFNGGGTLNNKMVTKDIILMFETLGVYYTVVFGNHDTEAFDYFNREKIGELYEKEKNKYCIFRSEGDCYGVTNQCIVLKNNAGHITKALMMIDSNDYIDTSISASINWKYDTIHDDQVLWAKEVIEDLSEKEGSIVKSLFFYHIPIGEFELAYRELANNNFENTENTKYVEGVWDEVVDPEMGGRIWYGACYRTGVDPASLDCLFEELGPDGLNSMEASFVGHDHTNNAVVMYRGAMLSYGYSIDNTAYDNIAKYGLQRGCTVITVDNTGYFYQRHKNVYIDYDIDSNKFFEVNLDNYYYDDIVTPKK